VKWLLLFGGIALFAVVLYALLGVWLWRRAKALMLEVEEAARKVEQALPEEQEVAAAIWPGGTDRRRVGAGDGHRPS
jgi:hypothetical protein